MASTTSPSAQVMEQLAPKGVLRATVNYGNPVLAHRNPQGKPEGVSVDLAHELARRLNLSLQLVEFDAAAKVFEAAGSDVWDVAFLASDPARASQMLFTQPEATCIVQAASRCTRFEDLDQPGVRIAVGRGAAYELQLSRKVKAAALVRAETSDAAVRMFLDEGLEAAAGVRRGLLDYAAAHSGLRVLDEPVAEILQGLGTPLGRTQAIAFLDGFLAEAKADGFVTARAPGGRAGLARRRFEALRPAAAAGESLGLAQHRTRKSNFSSPLVLAQPRHK
jgi:polar amino acid transport system substrate-binding protein